MLLGVSDAVKVDNLAADVAEVFAESKFGGG